MLLLAPQYKERPRNSKLLFYCGSKNIPVSDSKPGAMYKCPIGMLCSLSSQFAKL